MSSNEPPALLGVLASIFGLAAAIWSSWCTVIAFIGGTMPIVGIRVDSGSITGGLLMLFVGEPILITVAYWVGMLIFLPLIALTAAGKRSRP